MGCRGPVPRAPEPMPRALIPASTGRRRPAARRPGGAPRHDASSERPFLHLISDVLARAHRQRENRPRRVLVRLRYEGSAVRDEQILAVVRLAPAVRHGGLRVVPHARAAQLVDDDAAGGDAVPLFGARHRRERLTPHLRDERPEGVLPVAYLLVLVVGALPVEPQNWDAPPVPRVRVDLAVAVVVGDHLAAAREADRGAVVAAGVGLLPPALAPPPGGALDPLPHAGGKQGAGAPHPPVGAARGGQVCPLEPPRPG